MIRLIFMGTPSPVAPVLRRLRGIPDVEVLAALTPPDRPRGRGRRPEAPPVKEEALTLGIPVLQPSGLRNEEIQAELAAMSPDVIVVAAYGRLLPSPVLSLPPHGCLNLHPSLLPRHRGPSPVATSILEGDEVSGVSLMLLDEGMDTGPVVAQRQFDLLGSETAGELTNSLFELGGELLAENLDGWVNGRLRARPQEEGQATVTRKLERGDGLADWALPALVLARQCRAFNPWPGLYTEFIGKMLKVLEAAPLPGEDAIPETVGQVFAGCGGGLVVRTGDGILSLGRVQLEGRRAVSGEEFSRGYPEIIGAILGSQQSGKR